VFAGLGDHGELEEVGDDASVLMGEDVKTAPNTELSVQGVAEEFLERGDRCDASEEEIRSSEVCTPTLTLTRTWIMIKQDPPLLIYCAEEC